MYRIRGSPTSKYIYLVTEVYYDMFKALHLFINRYTVIFDYNRCNAFCCACLLFYMILSYVFVYGLYIQYISCDVCNLYCISDGIKYYIKVLLCKYLINTLLNITTVFCQKTNPPIYVTLAYIL